MVHHNDYFLPDNYEEKVTKNYSESDLLDHVIEKVLGKGAFGTVFLARMKRDNNMVAIKKISKDKGDATIFRNEYKNFKDLFHPYLIQYMGYFESRNYYNFVLEYAPNGTLESKIVERAGSKHYWTENEIAKMTADILLGLEFLHDNGIIHRDLKPDNIVIGADDQLKITDFGMAKVMAATGYAKLYASKFGHKCYAAPELLEGRKYDSSVDYWSFGVILYEMCTLSHPFTDKRPGTKLLRVPNFYSDKMNSIIEFMLEINPDDRCHEEDLKMEHIIKTHYDAAIKEFNDYWYARLDSCTPVRKQVTISYYRVFGKIDPLVR